MKAVSCYWASFSLILGMLPLRKVTADKYFSNYKLKGVNVYVFEEFRKLNEFLDCHIKLLQKVFVGLVNSEGEYER